MAKTADDRTFTRVAAVDEFRTDRGRMVYYQGTKVAVFRQGDSFFAVNDRCPHMGAAMSGGRITKGIIRLKNGLSTITLPSPASSPE